MFMPHDRLMSDFYTDGVTENSILLITGPLPGVVKYV